MLLLASGGGDLNLPTHFELSWKTCLLTTTYAGKCAQTFFASPCGSMISGFARASCKMAASAGRVSSAWKPKNGGSVIRILSCLTESPGNWTGEEGLHNFEKRQASLAGLEPPRTRPLGDCKPSVCLGAAWRSAEPWKDQGLVRDLLRVR